MARSWVQAACLLCLSLHITCSWLIASEAAAQQQNLAKPDYNIYLKKNDLLKKVEELVAAHPDMMKIEVRHAQDGEYKADLQVVTVEPGGLSPSHGTKARLLIDFGEHGREFISSEVGLRLLQTLADPAQLEQVVGSSKRLARIQAILQRTVLKILPMENIHGRDLVEGGQLCERKNGRGVDTNRNWDIDWGKKEKDYDPREEFPGRTPHSEPEVQILLALAKELQPHTWLNVHSGMYALFTPYDHKAAVPNTTDARAALRMLQRVKELSCPECVVGSGGHSVGYLAHGTGTDYMYEVLGVPMSFTWEIYGDENATFEDCFRMFNPVGKDQFERVVSLWVKALLQLLELLPTHPATWPLFKNAGLDAAAAAVEPAAQQQQQQGQEKQQQQEQEDQDQEQQPDSDSGPTAAGSPEAVVEEDDEYQGAEQEAGSSDTSSDEQQQQSDQLVQEQQPQQQQQAPASSSAAVPEVSIQVVKGLGSSQRDGSAGAWAVINSNQVLLIIGLVGMGVVLFWVTRTQPGAYYTRMGRPRTL